MLNILEQSSVSQDFELFISSFKSRLATLFNTEYDYNAMSLSRGLPPTFLNEIMAFTPLSVAVPTQYGGRGACVKECLGVLAAASYESLPLSLMFGINIALFLEPFAKYGNESLKPYIFDKFLKEKAMGGLMITEPNFGSDALNMRTNYEYQNDHFHINGQKHWQGLTGAADFWLVTARKRVSNGELARDIDFFVTDNSIEEQKIAVQHKFNNLGLYAIPYGLNNINVKVPSSNRLNPESTGIKLMLDTLHRSRLQFPGMGMGFIKRLLDESLKHCNERIVGGQPLSTVDSVKFQLSRIQSAYTLCSAMCSYSTQVSSIQNDVSGNAIDANSIKALVTDLMQESAQISLQLAGANGYRLDHIAGRSVVDSRPFQIFEGSNEMLYAQVAEGILKLMRKSKSLNFLSFLRQYKETDLAAPFFSSMLNFDIPDLPKQRQLVTLGRIIARIICFQFVLRINNAGFSDVMTELTRQHMVMDLSMLIGQWTSVVQADPMIDYADDSDWLKFCK